MNNALVYPASPYCVIGSVAVIPSRGVISDSFGMKLAIGL